VPKVAIDKQSCLSSERCILAAPEAFVLDDDHLAEVLPAASDLPVETLVAIAKNCPAFAISVFDDDGDEIDLD